MKRIIIGGTGFVGQHLAHHWLQQGYEVTIVGRRKSTIRMIFGEKVTAMDWQNFISKGLEECRESDVVVNLAGANIGEKPWKNLRKRQIMESRLNTTETVVRIMTLLGDEAPPLLNASAIGIYGLQETVKKGLPPALDENTKVNFNDAPDFVSKVARAWEVATHDGAERGLRVVNLRFAVILGPGGVLKKLKVPFYFGLGGPLGSGHQAFSWVSMLDVIRAIDFILKQKDLSGPINLVSPQCLQQRDFAKALGKAMKRPSFFWTPSFSLKFFYGQMADELLLKGQHIKPTRLESLGFHFQHPDVNQALDAIFSLK